MFNRIVVDTTSYPSSLFLGEGEILQVHEARLLACMYFVADRVIEIVMVPKNEEQQLSLFNEPEAWAPISSAEVRKRKLPLYTLQGREHTVEATMNLQLGYESYRPRNSDGSGRLVALSDQADMLLSSNPNLKWRWMNRQNPSGNLAVLTLAAAGVSVSLPSVQFSMAYREEYLKVKTELEAERMAYLGAITRYAEGAAERLKGTSSPEIIRWAEDQATYKIRPRVIELELALKKLDRSLLKKLFFSLFTEGSPALGSSLVDIGEVKEKANLLGRLLEAFNKKLAAERIEERYPDAVYQLRLFDKVG